jgi:hypothetical protein
MGRKLKKALRIGSALVMAMTIVCYFQGKLFLMDDCEEKIVTSKDSPNRWFRAVQTVRECGATTEGAGYVLKIIPLVGPLSRIFTTEVCSNSRGYDFSWESSRTIRTSTDCPFNVNNKNPYFFLRLNP